MHGSLMTDSQPVTLNILLGGRGGGWDLEGDWVAWRRGRGGALP
jgi:hypothetical protein